MEEILLCIKFLSHSPDGFRFHVSITFCSRALLISTLFFRYRDSFELTKWKWEINMESSGDATLSE
jgi:hypothetical protein